jgi:CheY-like chemotaxis protein
VILLPEAHDQPRKQRQGAAAQLREFWQVCHPSTWHWRGSLHPIALVDLAARTTTRLVRHLAMDRHGRPWLQVTLRRATASAAAVAPPPETTPIRQLTILLVEPDRTIRRNLTRLLQHARVAVFPVSGGCTATEALQTAALAGVRFHAVVMNARLRDTTSMALVHELRLLVPKLPILLICAPRTPLPFGRVSQNTPVLPLVTPVSWAQIAAGLERAVGAVYPAEFIGHASTVADGHAEHPTSAPADPVHDEAAEESAPAVVAVHS